ncbi:MAG: chemotaxis protein CheA [Bacteroidales bacterium]|nr:chemotaxis protein CheA [Bacteroidales bacterium]
MDKLRQKFIEEASEHIRDIEQSLLTLESNPDNHELIEKIFRSLHTLKGSGAMFGFEKISEFTHELETIYDLIRNNKLILGKEVFDLTLACADHLKILISDEKKDNAEINEEYRNLLEKIHEVYSGESMPGKPSANQKDKKTADTGSDLSTYYIYFKPNADIFDNGTNPLFLIDELTSLGHFMAIPYLQDIPEIETIEPYRCYTHWEVIFATSESSDTLNEIFLFVEDNCVLDIQKLANGNLVDNKKFVKRIEKLKETGKDIGIDALKIISEDLEQSVASKVKKALGDEFRTSFRDYTISSIRVASEKLDHLMNLVSELVTTQARLSLYSENDSSSELTAISENIQKLSRQLRDLAFEIVLVPIDTLITRFQRLVRDLSKELGKEVSFIAKGTETELDKTIIENLTDPLMHIIRNCIDHGIETTEERLKKGKPEQGTILLNAYHSSTNVHIEISDDGKGIDAEKVRKKAVAKGLITEDNYLTEKQIYELLFLPGFSTAEHVTDVSGRGVGMDVVKQKITNIRGEIEIESSKNAGTKLTLKVPLTLSIIDGLLVRVEDIFYLIPLSAVEKIYAINHEDIDGKFNNLIVLGGERIPYFYLRKEFNLEADNNINDQVIVIKYETQKVGLVVDEVIGEYQAVLKPLGRHYKNQEIISAATILGDGTIALVIDVNRAVNHFANIITHMEEKI